MYLAHPPVLSKKNFYKRWRDMEFGNRGHSWDTLREAMASEVGGLFAIRYKTPGSKWMRYNIPKQDLKAVADEFLADGAKEHLLEYSPMQDDSHIRLQGEVQLDHRGLCLLYSTEKLPMRQALAKSPRNATGATAASVLRWACDDASFTDISDLLERYPAHVVEFSSYGRSVGVIPNRNTIIWEVRLY